MECGTARVLNHPSPMNLRLLPPLSSAKVAGRRRPWPWLWPLHTEPSQPISPTLTFCAPPPPSSSYSSFSTFCSSGSSSSNCAGTGGVSDGEALDGGKGRRSVLNVVLVSPQIAGNTGAIARTCAASAVSLHLVEPLGYKIDDVKLKRAGLDYWPYVVVKIHSSWREFRDYFYKQAGDKRLLAFTKRGAKIHSEFSYKLGDWLVFGSETSGLAPEVLLDCSSKDIGGGTIRIPMVETYVRCLNLSVSVGIALYEASRQLNYEQMQCPPNADGADGHRLFISEDIYA